MDLHRLDALIPFTTRLALDYLDRVAASRGRRLSIMTVEEERQYVDDQIDGVMGMLNGPLFSMHPHRQAPRGLA